MFPLNLGAGWRLEIEWDGSITSNSFSIMAIAEIDGFVQPQIVFDSMVSSVFATKTILCPLSPGKLLGIVISTGYAISALDYTKCHVYISKSDSLNIQRQIPLWYGSLVLGSPIIITGADKSFDDLLFSTPQVFSQAVGAGVDLSFSITSINSCLLDSLYFKFTTDATSASRWVKLKITDAGGDVKYITGFNFSQSASLVWEYCFSRDGLSAASGNLQACMALPSITLFLGDIIKTYITNIQATDQIANVSVALRINS